MSAEQAPTESVVAVVAEEVDPILERGRWIAEAFADKRFQYLFDHSGPAMQAALTVQGWADAYEQITGLYGSAGPVTKESVEQDQPDLFTYRRVAQWDLLEASLVTTVVLDENGELMGFFVAAEPTAAPTRFPDYETQTPLSLPLEGQWTVVWGGRTLEENYHVVSPEQRFALDLLVIEGDKSFVNVGATNEDYLAFGRPVFAPGDGVVIASENGVVDNVPGEMNPAQMLGNHVVIDHGNGEYSFLAHFKQGTVSVATGDQVTRGQRLGDCGNSGNSTEPHIHYHLQNTTNHLKGEGLPAQFVEYFADGVAVPVGEPVRKQVIEPMVGQAR